VHKVDLRGVSEAASSRVWSIVRILQACAESVHKLRRSRRSIKRLHLRCLDMLYTYRYHDSVIHPVSRTTRTTRTTRTANTIAEC
jgi:hypothetical protein